MHASELTYAIKQDSFKADLVVFRSEVHLSALNHYNYHLASPVLVFYLNFPFGQLSWKSSCKIVPV